MHHRLGLCLMGVPGFVEEGETFAAYCDLYLRR